MAPALVRRSLLAAAGAAALASAGFVGHDAAAAQKVVSVQKGQERCFTKNTTANVCAPTAVGVFVEQGGQPVAGAVVSPAGACVGVSHQIPLCVETTPVG